jgi:tRNA(His) 5'-end guanylyltransferase
MSDSLGDRMKGYENVFRQYLPKRMPVICRLDGRSFHNYTKGCARPIDENLVSCMNETAIYLCHNIQGTKIAYVQSDEISLLITNDETNETQPFVGNCLPKIVSLSAGMASAYFTSISDRIFGKQKLAVFDSRAFVLPINEVNNYMIWRQNDATRNSVSSLAQSLYSHKALHGKRNAELQELIWQKGINWDKLPTTQKRGRCIVKVQVEKPAVNRKTGEVITAIRSEWIVDNEVPIFSKNKDYVNRYLEIKNYDDDIDLDS